MEVRLGPAPAGPGFDGHGHRPGAAAPRRELGVPEEAAVAGAGGAAPASGPERDSAFGRAQTVDEDDVAVPLAAVQPKAVVNYSPYAGPLDP